MYVADMLIVTFYVASLLPDVFTVTIKDVDSRAAGLQYPPCQGVVGHAGPVVTDLDQPRSGDEGMEEM